MKVFGITKVIVNDTVVFTTRMSFTKTSSTESILNRNAIPYCIVEAFIDSKGRKHKAKLLVRFTTMSSTEFATFVSKLNHARYKIDLAKVLAKYDYVESDHGTIDHKQYLESVEELPF